MSNRILSLFFILTLALQVHAQHNKGYIGFTIGPSMPLSEFGSKDENNDDAGWANTGAVTEIMFAYKLGGGNFGITALLRGQAHPLDEDAIENAYTKQFQGINWRVESDVWTLGGLMVGGFGSFPISEKASFDARALIGLMNATSPEIKVNGSVSGGSAWIKQSRKEASSLSLLFGAGFKFDLSSRLCFLTNFDILQSVQEFNNIETTTSFGTRETNTRKQNMASFNLGLGLAYKF